MIQSLSACFIAFLAGALRVASPDHWVPVSLMAWRREWSATRTLALSLLASAAHLALGYFLYLLVFWNETGIQLSRGVGFAVLMIAVLRLMVFRRRLNEVMSGSGEGSDIQSFWTALSFMGPAELFALALTFEDPRVAFYFAAGSLLFPGFYAAVGTQLWNRPYGVSRGLSIASGHSAWIPLGLIAVVGWFSFN